MMIMLNRKRQHGDGQYEKYVSHEKNSHRLGRNEEQNAVTVYR